MNKQQLIGQKVSIYQTPTEFEGYATVMSMTNTSPILEAIEGNRKSWAFYAWVKFEGGLDNNEKFLRWFRVYEYTDSNRLITYLK